jgi:hypothetical protein
MTQKLHLDLFADYFQFYLQDESVDGNLGESWTPEAVDRLLALTHGAIGVGTVRNVTVPVDIEIAVDEPAYKIEDWDQINECSIDLPTGCIVVAGCTDYFPEAARVRVKPGTYRARVFYENLSSLHNDGLQGDDRYKVVLWPAPSSSIVVVKRRTEKQ